MFVYHCDGIGISSCILERLGQKFCWEALLCVESMSVYHCDGTGISSCCYVVLYLFAQFSNGDDLVYSPK